MKINNKLNFFIETLFVAWFFIVYFFYIYFHSNPLSFIPIILGGFFLLAFWYFAIKPLKYEINLRVNKPLWQACLFLLVTILGAAVFVRLLGNVFTENLNFFPFLLTEFAVVKNILIKILFLSGLVLLCAGVGKKIFNILKFNIENKKEEFVFAFGLGFLAINYFAFFLTALGWLYFWPSLILIISFVIFSWTQIKYFINIFLKTKFEFNISADFKDVKNLESWIWVIIGLFLIVAFISTFKLFPVETDDLVAYFNIPYLYAHYHRLIPFYNTPEAISGGIGMPLYALINILFAPHFVFQLAWMFFAFLLGTVYVFVDKFFSEKTALTILLLSVFVPWNYFFITTQKIIFIFTFISALALFSFFIWLNNKDKKFYSSTYWLYLSAIFSGYSASLKINGLFLIGSLSVFIFGLFVFKKINFKKSAIFGLLVMLFFLPMITINLHYYNNPLGLFKISFFVQKTQSLFKQGEKVAIYDIYSKTDFSAKRIYKLTQSGYLNHITSSTVVNFFWRIWNTTVAQKGYKNINTEISPYLLIFIPFFIFYFIKNKYYKEKNILYLSIISSIFFAMWYLRGAERPWYGIAIFYFLFIFSAIALQQIKNKKYIFIIYFIVIAFCFRTFAGLASAISVPTNSIYNSIQICQKTHNETPKLKMNNLINEKIISKNNNALVLLFFETATSDIKQNDKVTISDRRGIYWGKILQETKSLNEAKNVLVNQGITHILYNINFKNGLKNLAQNDFENGYEIINEIEKFEEFKNEYLKEIYCEEKQFCIYEIKK